MTIDACVTSQFEQQVRAVCGLPLGSVDQHAPAAMVISETKNRKTDTKRDANRYATKFTNPTVVERVLQKERSREEDQ